MDTIRRITAAVAATGIAGAVLLGATGTASAAPVDTGARKVVVSPDARLAAVSPDARLAARKV